MKFVYIHNKWQRFLILFVTAVFVAAIFCVSFYTVNKKAETVYKGVMNDLTVIIDPGHGGIDGGAVAKDGTVEKDINLAVSFKLKMILVLLGYNVVMTRETDCLICDSECSTIREKKSSDLHNRAEILKKYENAVLISVHQNKYSVSKYSGTQVFYSGNDAASREIALSVQETVSETLQPENTRQIKQSGSEIFLLYTAKKPAIMVECGFISNIDELLKLKSDGYQTQMALAIALGINNYYCKREVYYG